MERGNFISELRREAGFTQKSLADALNITDKAVSKWERGLCLPDVSLLPKLSLLLGTDIEVLLSKNKEGETEEWVGLLDFRDSGIDLSRPIYDKPAVYYILSHYMLLGIKKVIVLCSSGNEAYLKSSYYAELGFTFIFNCEELPKENFIIMKQPHFLFGSDLTRLFNGMQMSGTVTKACPVNAPVPFLFCPSGYAFLYLKRPEFLYETATERSFGRGMVCMELDGPDSFQDASDFVRMYQKRTGLLIGCLEEIAFRQGMITEERLKIMLQGKTYGAELLKTLKVEFE